MKCLALATAALFLPGAAPPGDAVPTGVFRTWGVRPATPLRFTSGGLVITVEARPCPTPPDTEGCRFDHANNQASIVVRAPGLPPFRMASDRQASFVRVAAIRLDRRDARAGVVVDNQWGGSAGITAVTVIEPVSGGFRAVPLRGPGGVDVEGQIADHPRDVSGDGITDFILEDSRIGGYGCNACSPHPPLVLSAIAGRSTDVSTRAPTRSVFARHEARVGKICMSRQGDRNGNCAAYVADAARRGRFATAWRTMLAHYQRGSQRELWQDCTGPRDDDICPSAWLTHFRTFPESLRALLASTGYITPAQAAAAPLS